MFYLTTHSTHFHSYMASEMNNEDLVTAKVVYLRLVQFLSLECGIPFYQEIRDQRGPEKQQQQQQ